jgi:hypothetical protein
MTVQYDPNAEEFDPHNCGAALLAAVTQLAVHTGQTLDDFRGRPLAELGPAASDAYGEDLPEFWQVWSSWHTQRPTPDMGDL